MFPIMPISSKRRKQIYVDDVFQNYVRTGNGAEQTITTNINMTKGYMIWSKGRSNATDHAIYDSIRGVTKDLVTNSTAAETTQAEGLKSISSTGHTWGTLAKINTSTATYVDWIFRKAPKFFDIVTYIGNDIDNREIPHNLGYDVGMLIVKRMDSSIYGGWLVWHRNNGITHKNLCLNNTGSSITSERIAPTSTSFYVKNSTTYIGGENQSDNINGATYVAYIFAHDDSEDGMIQCGSFTTDGSGNGTISHGWSDGVQYLKLKCATTTDDWEIYDTTRTSAFSNNDARLRANLNNAEDSVARVAPSGTTLLLSGLSASQTYIYMIIKAA